MIWSYNDLSTVIYKTNQVFANHFILLLHLQGADAVTQDILSMFFGCF